MSVPSPTSPLTSAMCSLPSMTLAEIAVRVLRPFVAGEIDDAGLDAIAGGALDFPMSDQVSDGDEREVVLGGEHL